MSVIEHSICPICGDWRSDAETDPEQRARINAAFAGVKSGELANVREQLRGAVDALRAASVALNDVTANNADRVARARAAIRDGLAAAGGQ